MQISEQIPDSDATFLRRGEGELAVVFVHGFLDDQHVWDKVIDELKTPGIETIRLDLAGLGDRAGAGGPFTYERLADEVGAVTDRVGKPFVIVGQSMGAPIAELVATARSERALGLVLLTPVPLAGTRLPDEVVEPFRSLGADAEAQRDLRQQLSVALSDADLDRLVTIGLRVRPEVVASLVDCWNTGLPDAPERSRYAGPVLVVRGGDDGLVTEELVATAVSPRFASVQTVVIERAGHWPHVEQPAALAAQLDRFLTEHATSADGNIAADARPQGWTNAFASKSAEAFGEAFADDVVLEASVLTRPIEGRDRVMQVMGTASAIYESLVFTHEASAGPRTYLEWEATAFGGMAIRGVTVLTKDADGRVVRAAIHHRPLWAALRFSSELGQRLTGTVDAEHFYGRAEGAQSTLPVARGPSIAGQSTDEADGGSSAPDTVSTPKEQEMSQVRFEREGPVGSIVLNHPPQNRIGHQMMLDLTDAVAEASVSDIRVLLVRGDGPDFCFGGDVREWPDATPHGLRSFTSRVNAAFRAIELLPIPTVAVVQGAAYGGGFELALSCDLILAAESAHFRFIEATIAVPPLAGGVQRLAERIGRSAAARLILLAQRVSASELADLQVVAKVVADTELDDEAAALAAQLASGPTRAHAATKALLQAWATGGLATADRLMPDLVSHLFQTEDVAAGLDAAVTALETGTKRPMLAFQGK